MAPATSLVSVSEYLATDYVPHAEYEDGVLRPKAMPTYKHSMIQFIVAALIMRYRPDWVAGPEQTVQVREGKFLIPDVVAQFRAELQDPYPTKPVPLCVEVLSPDDHFSQTLAKCEEYHRWGVAVTWIVDPAERRAWTFRPNQRPHEVLLTSNLEADGLSIPLAEVFNVLD
jgi:Uma2 family endonuclease